MLVALLGRIFERTQDKGEVRRAAVNLQIRLIDYPIVHSLDPNCIMEFHHCELVARPSPESRAPFRFRDVDAGLEASPSDWSGR